MGHGALKRFFVWISRCIETNDRLVDKLAVSWQRAFYFMTKGPMSKTDDIDDILASSGDLQKFLVKVSVLTLVRVELQNLLIFELLK